MDNSNFVGEGPVDELGPVFGFSAFEGLFGGLDIYVDGPGQ